MGEVRPITTPLPQTAELFESLFKGKRRIKPDVRDIMVHLWDNDKKFVELLQAEYHEQAVHGDWKLDQAFAAERIIAEAAKRGWMHVVELKTKRVRLIMRDVLKDHHLDRQSRIKGLVAHATRGPHIPDDDTDAAE